MPYTVSASRTLDAAANRETPCQGHHQPPFRLALVKSVSGRSHESGFGIQDQVARYDPP